MNLQYLETLPALENQYDFPLDEGEKVIFSTEFSSFGDENGTALCAFDYTPKLSVTNEKIYIRTSDEIYWSIDFEDEVADCRKITTKLLLFFKVTYFEIGLLQKAEYTNGNRTQKVAAYRLYFNKMDCTGFEALMNKVLE